MNSIANMCIWKKKDETAVKDLEFKEASIDNLCLTNRPVNCLKRVGCKTIGDLVKIIDSETGLKSVRNLGTKSEQEILEKLNEFRETFKLKSPGGQVCSSGSVSSFKGLLLKPKGKAWYTKIEEYGIPSSSVEFLHGCGVYYVADLYTANLVKDPGWKAVSELFEAMVTAWMKQN